MPIFEKKIRSLNNSKWRKHSLFSQLTMHHTKGLQDSRVWCSSVWMWCHDTNNRCLFRIKACSNYTQNDIFTSENACQRALVHDKYCSGVVRFHQLSNLFHAGLEFD